MATENQTKAFVFGALLGGIAAATYAVFHAPASGAEIRGDIAADVENTVYRWMGMDKPKGVDLAAINDNGRVSASGKLILRYAASRNRALGALTLSTLSSPVWC